MALFPEREKRESYKERPEEISPLNIERKEVVTPTPGQFTAQVTDDKGQPLIQTPKSQTTTVTLPKSEASLEALAKGETEESATWWAASWLRLIKKAFHFGRKLIFGEK